MTNYLACLRVYMRRALWRLVPQSNGTFLIVNHQTNRLLLDTSSALNRNATCAGPPSSPAASQPPSLPQVVTADDNYDGRAVWRISGFHLEPGASHICNAAMLV